MICLEQISLSFGDKPVLDRFSLTLPEQGVTVLSGPSGCGKTTLLRILAGLEVSQSGRVSGISPERTAVLFQEDRLLPGRTVRQQLTDVMAKSRHSEVAKWLELAELTGEDALFPRELSGGMGRRLALARCLALGGDLYLLDEPFAGIDLPRRRRLMAALKQLGKPVVLVSHEPEVLELADHVLSFDGPPLTLIKQASNAPT